jgi:hypothetical protein
MADSSGIRRTIKIESFVFTNIISPDENLSISLLLLTIQYLGGFEK